MPCYFLKEIFLPDVENYVIISVVCTLWSILFLENWERESKIVAYRYGTLSSHASGSQGNQLTSNLSNQDSGYTLQN